MNTTEETIRKGETSELEFKRIPNEDRDKYLKTVVAFANGSGGRILFGVANDRTVIGIAKKDVFSEMDAITSSIADACTPKIPIDVSVEDIDGKSVIVLDVYPGTRCPYHLKREGDKDGVYIRVGATTRRADDATRHELSLSSEGRSYDCEPCLKAKIDEKHINALCAKMFRLAKENCSTTAERRSIRRITPSQLEDWGIISRVRGKWVPSVAYALLTGDRSFAIRAKCGVFKGNDKAIFLDRRQIEGSVCDLVDKTLEYVLSKINMGCTFKGAFRQDVYELPPDAIRELIVNAFVHRNYFEHSAPIFVAVYDTRVEITSPGGMPRGMTVEKALEGHSKIRNRALAEAFSYMRYVEGWGSGFRRVNSDLSNYGARPVEVEDSGIDVRINIFRANGLNTTASIDDQLLNPDMTTGMKTGMKIGMKTADAILSAIKIDPSVSIDRLAKITGKARSTIQESIARLKSAGIVRRVGPDRGGHWEVIG